MSLRWHEYLNWAGGRVSRRGFVESVSAGAVAGGLFGSMGLPGLRADELKKQGKSLIVLWMSGGPSQMETFDPKPGTDNGGETKAIATNVPGIEIATGWEPLASVANELAIIRSLSNKEGNHQRATYQLHTGYVPAGSIKHPAFSSNVAKELADRAHDLPAVVTMGQLLPSIGSGFLGVDYEPFHVQKAGSPPDNVTSLVGDDRFKRRLGLLGKLESEFAYRGGQTVVTNHQGLYEKASRLVVSPLTKAFDLSDEPDAVQEAYGKNDFGRGCLLARRLIETGVTCVEVRMNGWDTHDDNFNRVKSLAGTVAPAAASLIKELKSRGRLDDTVVLWMGEFGRTPKINPRGGRDHFPRAFNAWVAGGGLRCGQVIGATSKDGTAVADRPVSVNDLLSTVSHALGVNAKHENMSPIGRPLKIVDGGEPIKELIG